MKQVHFDVEEAQEKIAQKSNKRSAGNVAPARGTQVKHQLKVNSFPFLDEGISPEILNAINAGLPKDETFNMKLEEVREGQDIYGRVIDQFSP